VRPCGARAAAETSDRDRLNAEILRLNKEIQAIVAMPDVKQKLLDLGVEARGSTPQALDQLLVAEIDKWKQVVARAKIEKQ